MQAGRLNSIRAAIKINSAIIICFKNKEFPGKVVAFNRQGFVEAKANGKKYFGSIDAQGKRLGNVTQI